MSKRNSRSVLAFVGALGLLACGCDRPVDAPVRPLISAASASPFAIDLDFDRPQSRASISSKADYSLKRAGTGGPGTSPTRVQFIDTLFGETVRLVFPLGTMEDSAAYEVTVHGARDANSVAYLPGDSAVVPLQTGLGYARNIRDLLERRCERCHGNQSPAAGYGTTSYNALFAFGSDSASAHPIHNLIPSDAQCLFVTRTSPKGREFLRSHLTYAESEMLRNWVVSYQARP